MQITIVERQGFTDALFEGKPAVLNGIQIRGVGWQEFLRTARAFNEPARLGGLMEAGVIIDHHLPGFENRHQAVVDIRFKEGGVAGPLEHEGGDEGVVVERSKQTHALGAMPGLLPPTGFTLRTPPVRPGFIIIHARLIQIHQLLGGYSRQLGTKLLPQLLISLGIAKGLFLCV
jgi:hypothetical protein